MGGIRRARAINLQVVEAIYLAPETTPTRLLRGKRIAMLAVAELCRILVLLIDIWKA